MKKKHRIMNLEAENAALKGVLAEDIRIYLAEQQWLGVGSMLISVDVGEGKMVEIDRIAYQPGRSWYPV